MRAMRKAVLGILLGISILSGSLTILLLSFYIINPNQSGSGSVMIIDRDGGVQIEPPITVRDKVAAIVFPIILLLLSILLGVYCYRQIIRRPLKTDSALKSTSTPNSYVE